MDVTGMRTLDHASQAFAEWLNDHRDHPGWQKPRAYFLLCETLHAIRNLLTVDEASDPPAQLSVLVRGVSFDGWDPSRTPVKPRAMGYLLTRVEARFQKEPFENTERTITAVFDLLRHHVSWGRVPASKVRHAQTDTGTLGLEPCTVYQRVSGPSGAR